MMNDEENPTPVNVDSRWCDLDTRGSGGISKPDNLTPDRIQEAL